MRRSLAVTAFAAVVLALGGCTDEARDEARDELDEALDDLEEAADTAGARVVAEAIRLAILVEADDDENGRSVAVIEEAIGLLPGEPDVSGIADGDEDGLDDDGRLIVRANDEVACVSLARRVTDFDHIDVYNGPCEETETETETTG